MSCADIIRPSQQYVPADSTLTIGTLPTSNYQECGKQCRITTLCRTAVWCQGRCTMYQEYIAFGKRLPDLNCMLITLSGIAFNEIEPTIFIADQIAYEPSQTKYYEQTYPVTSLDECIQLCRLDSHCLTASFQSSTTSCSLFAEQASQGRNYTDPDWKTIILDTCAGRDPRIYPCLIDATQAHRTLCELFTNAQPSKLTGKDTPGQSNGLTGWLTKLSVYWPVLNNNQAGVVQAPYNLKTSKSLVTSFQSETESTRYLHVNVNQRESKPVVYIGSQFSGDNRIYRIQLTDQQINTMNSSIFLSLTQHCRSCYFAVDGSNNTYVSMDEIDSIEGYDSNGQKFVSLHLKSPAGIIVRNHDLWILSDTQLAIMKPTVLSNSIVSYFGANIMIDLATLYSLPMTNPLFPSYYSTFVPFHLDVDNYGRVYVVGVLTDLVSINNHRLQDSSPQMYIFTGAEEGIPLASCAGPWGMYGVSVYHSKTKFYTLTSANNLSLYLYSGP